MKTVRLTLAQAIVRFLAAQRLRRDGETHRFFAGVMGIFGHGNVAGLGQALEETRALDFWQPKNEQAMVHTAVAYAKARRRLSAWACTTSVGPGATNMVTGAATATINRLPVLLLPGDVFAGRLPQPVLQQLEHPGSMDVSVNDCFRPVSRYWDRLQRPEQVLYALPEAMRVLCDPAETGAVTLCLPEDVQAEAFDCPAHFLEERITEVERRPCAPSRLAEARLLLGKARRPLLVAGGGVHYAEATAALEKLATATGMPVAVTQAGTGALLDAHPSSVGGLGVTGTAAANALAERADVVLLLGTRLSDFTTASKTQFQAEGVRFVSVNLNAYDAQKHGALPLVGDLRLVLEELAGLGRVGADYGREIAERKSAWETTRQALVKSTGPLTQAEVIDVVGEALGEHGTVVHAAGGLPGDLHKLWRARSHDGYHSEYGYSCMGYEIAGALGVKLARPERRVVALLGDGSYLMLSQELLTSIQEGHKITAVVLDNHGYQCIQGLQQSCGGRPFGNEFRMKSGAPLGIDFEMNARSLGAETFRATTAAELRAALQAADASERSAVIYVPLERSALPGTSWWDVPPSEVSEVESVRAARAAYEEARRRQRFYY